MSDNLNKDSSETEDVFMYALADVLINSGIIDTEDLKQSIIKWRKHMGVESKEEPLAFLSPKQIDCNEILTAPSLESVRNIMIVDDVVFIREMIKRTLLLNGYKVIAEAGNGEEAVEKFNANKPDLVLMDIEMKKMSGLEALRIIRESDTITPVVIMTGNPKKDYLKEALKWGTTDFIIKPVDINRLLTVLNKFSCF